MTPIVDTLEPLIDKHGMVHVLAGLALICFEKAEHLRSNWQDDNSAKVWDRAGRAIDRFATHAAITTLES